MNPAEVAVSIIGAFAAVIGVYLAARSNAREARESRNREVAKSVADATAPLLLQVTSLRETVRQHVELLREKERRIESLEDELRRAGR